MGKQTQYSSDRKKASKPKTFLEVLLEKTRKGCEERMKHEHEKRMKHEHEKRTILYKRLMRQLSRAWQDLMAKNMKDGINLMGSKPPCTCVKHSLSKINVLCHTYDRLIYIREIKCGTCCTKPRLFLELTPNGESAKRNDPVCKDVLDRILYDWNRKGRRF